MSQKSSAPAAKPSAEKVVREVRRATRKHHSAEDYSRIPSFRIVSCSVEVVRALGC
jgi:hypothetical protein